MARYTGIYINDFGQRSYAWLTVGLVSGVTLLTSRGAFELTTQDFDAQYLPQIFINNTKLIVDRVIPECRSSLIKRFAKLYVANDQFLKIDLPFVPNSTEFNQFFIDAYFRNIGQVLTIGYEGEFQGHHDLRVIQ